jgi:tetratricopeptide (TPR) repeat protein
MALIHKQIGQSQEAMTIYRQALTLMRETHQREGEAAALNNMAEILQDTGHLQEALILFEQALSIMDELDAEENE